MKIPKPSHILFPRAAVGDKVLIQGYFLENNYVAADIGKFKDKEKEKWNEDLLLMKVCSSV